MRLHNEATGQSVTTEVPEAIINYKLRGFREVEQTAQVVEPEVSQELALFINEGEQEIG